MKIYLTTENGAYIAEIDELLYKDISEKFSLNKKYKTYSTFYNEKMKMTEIKIKTDELNQYLKDNFIKIDSSSIDINIEKKLKKYFSRVLKLLENNDVFFMDEDELKKLKEIYKVFYSLSITEWKEAIKEIIEKKLKRENYLDFDLDSEIESIFYKEQNKKEIKNKEIGDFILEENEILTNFEALYSIPKNSQNFKFVFNIPFYFPIAIDFYFLYFILEIFKEQEIHIVIKDDIQINLYNLFKNYEKEINQKYKEIIDNYSKLDKLQKKLIIVYIISIFENFLKEFFSRLIFFDGGYFIKILEQFQKKIKIPENLGEIPDFSKKLIKNVKELILRTTFHNPQKINDYLGILYQIDKKNIKNFYNTQLYEHFIKYRHLVCHREGKNENNEELKEFTLSKLKKHIQNIENIINKVVEVIKIEE